MRTDHHWGKEEGGLNSFMTPPHQPQNTETLELVIIIASLKQFKEFFFSTSTWGFVDYTKHVDSSVEILDSDLHHVPQLKIFKVPSVLSHISHLTCMSTWMTNCLWKYYCHNVLSNFIFLSLVKIWQCYMQNL